MILIIALVVLILLKVSMLKEEIYVNNTISSHNSNTLVENYLVQQTPIDGGKLFSDTYKNKQLKKNNNKLVKQNFFGVYVGIKNDHIIFTGQNGRANVSLGSAYKLHSVMMIGRYQEFLNNAMIISLASKHEINLDKKLSTYLPGINTGDLSVEEFLINGSSLFVSRKNANNVSLLPANNYHALKLSKTKLQGSISADNLVKCLLLSKVRDESYLKAFKHLAIDKMNLNNVDFNMSNSNEVNQILSYHARNKDIAKMRVIKINDSASGLNNIKMSIADVLSSFNSIYKNNYFDKKYNNIFMKSIVNSGLATKSGSVFVLSAGAYGQEFTIKYSQKYSKYLFSFVNVKDEKNIMTELQNLYNLL